MNRLVFAVIFLVYTSFNFLALGQGNEVPPLRQVPVICYHHIRPLAHGKLSRDYEVTPEEFHSQMMALKAAGYQTVLPDQLYNYLTTAKALPSKPIMITFDDTDVEQFTVGRTELMKYGFKGVFFVMTVSIGRPRYMSSNQIKTLSLEGHSICSHTWDHHNVNKYNDRDWTEQLEKPKKKLEMITGGKISYFAYPFGLWNEAAIEHLKSAGIKMAFQLSAKMSVTSSIYTVRRILIPGGWSTQRFIQSLKSYF